MKIRKSTAEMLAARLRSYAPNGDGYNTQYAHDLLDAADDVVFAARIKSIICELHDSELRGLACEGSDAPVEDTLGRLFDACGLDCSDEELAANV